MPTLSELASAAGVSVTVASRVMSDNPSANSLVAAKTRDRVLEIASRLGYRPNRAAEFLKKGQNSTIGVFLPCQHRNSLWADLMFGIAQEAERYNFPLSFYFNTTPESYHNFIRAASSSRSCGVISYPYYSALYTGEPAHCQSADQDLLKILNDYQNRGGKIIMIESAFSSHRFPEISSVSIDNHLGGILAARQLLTHSPDFAVTVDYPHIPERTASFCQIIREAGGISLKTFPHCDGCVSAIGEFIHTHRQYKTGIFLPRDQLAIDLMSYCRALQLEAGRDYYVIGYDNLNATEFLSPRLTTIAQPFDEIGRQAVRSLVDLIYSSPGNSPRTLLVSPSLIKRETA